MATVTVATKRVVKRVDEKTITLEMSTAEARVVEALLGATIANWSQAGDVSANLYSVLTRKLGSVGEGLQLKCSSFFESQPVFRPSATIK